MLVKLREKVLYLRLKVVLLGLLFIGVNQIILKMSLLGTNFVGIKVTKGIEQ